MQLCLWKPPWSLSVLLIDWNQTSCKDALQCSIARIWSSDRTRSLHVGHCVLIYKLAVINTKASCHSCHTPGQCTCILLNYNQAIIRLCVPAKDSLDVHYNFLRLWLLLISLHSTVYLVLIVDITSPTQHDQSKWNLLTFLGKGYTCWKTVIAAYNTVMSDGNVLSPKLLYYLDKDKFYC